MGIRRLILAAMSCAAFAAGPAHAQLPGAAAAAYACRFEQSWRECGFAVQAKSAGSATIVTAAGLRGVRLRTRPGDHGIAGSGRAERADLALSPEVTGCAEGAEQWWAHSVMFPEDYAAPIATPADPWAWGVVFDFHQTGSDGQANFQVEVLPDPVGLRFAVSGGAHVSNGSPGSATRRWPIGPITKGAWYHFVYHVKWSSRGDGFFDAWVNGEQKLEHRGPTLYAGQGCYLKLANYHTPAGNPVAVMHARVVRGATRAAVESSPQ